MAKEQMAELAGWRSANLPCSSPPRGVEVERGREGERQHPILQYARVTAPFAAYVTTRYANTGADDPGRGRVPEPGHARGAIVAA